MASLEHHRHNEYQREYYGHALKARMRPGATAYVTRHLDEVMRFGSLRSGETALDVGCGAGRHLFLLADRGLRMQGLELSPFHCEQARAYGNGRGIEIHNGDVAKPPRCLRGAVDVVTGFFMLHHLDDLQDAFRGVYRVLRPGGRMVFLEPNAWNPLYYLQILLTPGMHWRAEKGIIHMRRSELTRAAHSAGFEEVAYRTFGFFPPFARNTRWGGPLEAILECIPGLGPALPFQLMRASKPLKS